MPTDASRCVKCGLCLAHCPTYDWSRNEARSPRGRIALVQALECGELAPSTELRGLLDSCLLCRRCERVCPSGVAFGRILDTGLERTWRLASRRQRMAIALVSRPAVARGLLAAAALLRRLLPADSLLARVLRRGAGRRTGGAVLHPPVGRRRGRVALFAGCSGRLLDPAALEGAVTLLTRAGYQVQVPAGQVCCGALDAHSGNARRAERLRQKNEVVFGALGEVDAVISVASGCGAHLAAYPGLGARHADICAFLLAAGVPRRLHFRPLEGRVLVHTPCTLENGLQQGGAVFDLLRAVPGLEPEPLNSLGSCCGAGGLAFLAHPRMSRELRGPLAEAIWQAAPRYLVTANAGCGLHLEQGAGGPEYLHPVTLLARQLVVE